MRLQLLRSASTLLLRGQGRRLTTSSSVLLTQGQRSLTTTTRCHNTQHNVDKPAKAKVDSHTFSHGRQVAAAVYDDQQGWLEVCWADGGTTQYPYLWLRDNCTCEKCFSDSSQSRLFLMADLDVNNKPADVQVDADSGCVRVVWSDGHRSEYSAEWLEGRSFTPEVQEERRKWLLPTEVRHWGNELLGRIPAFTFDELMSDDRALYSWISSLEEIGLALVKEAPSREGQIKRIGDRVAFLRRTNYGESFTVKAKLDPSNLAYTPSTLGVHTDLSYYAYTPGMQMLHCIKQVPTEGGENQLGDGFRAAMILKDRHPDMFDLLVSTPVDYIDIGTDHYKFFKLARQPIIGLNRYGEVEKITFNNQVRDSFLHTSLEVVNKLYIALKTFNDIFYEPENHITYKLEDGDIVCFHNYRVLHGRTGYTLLGGGERHLEGGYIDWDELNSRRRVLLTELRLYE